MGLKLFALFFLLSILAAKPPEQPASGPGGREYHHTGVTRQVYGKDSEEYWIFEPAGPKPETAPIIVFNHGWSGMNPKIYGAWIDHIVRRGNIVIFPRYQADLRTPTREFTPNAIRAVKDAIHRLQNEGGHVRPDLDKFAIVGHSAGGQTTANLAALAKSSGLPKPKAVMCVEPGKSWNISQRIAIPLEDLSQIPKDTLLLAVVGEEDNIVRDIDAKRIFNESTQVPLANKDFIILTSDHHGEPALKADHFAPCAVGEKYDSGEEGKMGKEGILRARLRQRLGRKTENQPRNSVDALDYYGLWKLFDGLCNAAFYGKDSKYALGNTPEQRFMGRWSDGTPVKELVVTHNP